MSALRVAAAAVLPLLALSAAAQGTTADFQRCLGMREQVRDKVTRSGVEPQWIDGGPRFWYRADLGGGRQEIVVIDPQAGTRATADTPPSAEQPREARGGRRGGSRNGDAGERPRARGEDSPDGRWSLSVRGGNLFVRDRTTGEERALSDDGDASDSYEARVAWSPDSRYCVAIRTRAAEERKVYTIESSPKDQLQPKLHEQGYAKPGDPLPVRKPHLFDVPAHEQVAVDDALFQNPWSIDAIRWDADSSRFTFLYNQRGHQVFRLVAVDATTGEARTLIEETPPTFVDYTNKVFLRWLDDSRQFLWTSERDGWNHLYLCDAATGAIRKKLTEGDWVLRAVDRVDEKERRVWIRAMGIVPGQDPYHVHFARIDLDSGALTMLTQGDGTHELTWSPDRSFYLDSFSRVDQPPVVELRRGSDGSKVMDLEHADWTALLAAHWQIPERFVAKGRDGTTDIFGVIFRPSNFDPSRRYPVIEHVYAGPQDFFVPKSFAAWREMHSLTELGFIVVKIDGMGTNWRSKAFHDVCWKNLGDSGFPDRIAWIRAAAKDRPYMDLDRVGIYGGSAGGQSALRAMLAHGDFYKAAAADCGCHDNRMDKVWWNEQWMGWPIGPHYAEQSNVTNAKNLTGKLLLTVGELDRNVDPASTMQVVDALIAADKDFELIVFPGGGHGSGESPYGQRRRRDFFVRSLLGVEPRSH